MNKVVIREGAKNLNQMRHILENALGIKLLFTFIAINVCIIFSVFMPYTLLEKTYIFVFSFSLIYHSLDGLFKTVFQANEKMQYNAFLAILHQILYVPLAVILLYFGFGLKGLFIIALFSQFLTLVINFKFTKKFISFKFFNKIKLNKSLLKPALIFSIISFSILLITKIDLVMISWLGSSKDVGIYGVAYNLVNVGGSLGGFLSIAFFPIFVKIFQKRVVQRKILYKYAFMLSFGIFLIAIIGSFFSVEFITLLFGSKYTESGVILSVLIFVLAIEYFLIPFQNTIQATHNESKILAISWIAPLLNIGLNYLFFKMFGLIGIAYSTLVVRSIRLAIFLLITDKILKKRLY
jgi:O-antigen/teichoic acid export membrane protein